MNSINLAIYKNVLIAVMVYGCFLIYFVSFLYVLYFAANYYSNVSALIVKKKEIKQK